MTWLIQREYLPEKGDGEKPDREAKESVVSSSTMTSTSSNPPSGIRLTTTLTKRRSSITRGTRYFLMSGIRNGIQGIDQYALASRNFMAWKARGKMLKTGGLREVPSLRVLWIPVCIVLGSISPPRENRPCITGSLPEKDYAEVSRLNKIVIGTWSRNISSGEQIITGGHGSIRRSLNLAQPSRQPSGNCTKEVF